MSMNYIEKRVLGTGAALNIELGFIPSFVEIWNSDRDILWKGPLNTIFAFDDGNIELTPGMEIAKRNTVSPGGVIEDIFVTSGSWAGGDAAGWIVLSLDEQVGAFADNDVIGVRAQKGATARGDYADVAGAPLNNVLEIGPVASSKAVNGASTNETILPYRGVVPDATDATLDSGEPRVSLGITIGSSISENDKLLIIRAFKHGQG